MRFALIAASFLYAIFYFGNGWEAVYEDHHSTHLGIVFDSFWLSNELLVEYGLIHGGITCINKIWLIPHLFCTFCVIYYGPGENHNCDEIGFICKNIGRSFKWRLISYIFYFTIFLSVQMYFGFYSQRLQIFKCDKKITQRLVKHIGWVVGPLTYIYNRCMVEFDDNFNGCSYLWYGWFMAYLLFYISYSRNRLPNPIKGKSQFTNYRQICLILFILGMIFDNEFQFYVSLKMVNIMSFMLVVGGFYHIIYYDFCANYDNKDKKLCIWVNHKCILKNNSVFKTLFDICTFQALSFQHPMACILVALEYSCLAVSIYDCEHIIAINDKEINNAYDIVQIEFMIVLIFVFAGFLLDSIKDAIRNKNRNMELSLRDKYLTNHWQYPECVVTLFIIFLLWCYYAVFEFEFWRDFIVFPVIVYVIGVVIILAPLYHVCKIKFGEIDFAFGKTLFEGIAATISISFIMWYYWFCDLITININGDILLWYCSMFCRIVASSIAMDSIDVVGDNKNKYVTIATKYGKKKSYQFMSLMFGASFLFSLFVFKEPFSNFFVIAPLIAYLMSLINGMEYIHLYEMFVIMYLYQSF